MSGQTIGVLLWLALSIILVTLAGSLYFASNPSAYRIPSCRPGTSGMCIQSDNLIRVDCDAVLVRCDDDDRPRKGN